MRLVFTKGRGKTDDLSISRADGTTMRIACPKQGIVPHDMVHYAVERTLKKPGYFAQVAEGQSGYRMTSTVENDAVERLVETMQAELWSGRGDTQALIDLYELTCGARGHGSHQVSAAMIDTIRTMLDELTVRWNALAVGESLELTI